MNDSELKERLVDCFSALFPDLAREEIPRATMDSIEEWDSLASVSLIALIQEEFGVEIVPEDYERFVSFGLILELVKSKAQAA